MFVMFRIQEWDDVPGKMHIQHRTGARFVGDTVAAKLT